MSLLVVYLCVVDALSLIEAKAHKEVNDQLDSMLADSIFPCSHSGFLIPIFGSLRSYCSSAIAPTAKARETAQNGLPLNNPQ
jgi:hypothetical protein